uniref:(northern house mosquito) hypothetical protein n=1 Tax=Culex pipiens TaxID=7175 RepID=A0A8D8HHA8_CULPI
MPTWIAPNSSDRGKRVASVSTQQVGAVPPGKFVTRTRTSWPSAAWEVIRTTKGKICKYLEIRAGHATAMQVSMKRTWKEAALSKSAALRSTRWISCKLERPPYTRMESAVHGIGERVSN